MLFTLLNVQKYPFLKESVPLTDPKAHSDPGDRTASTRPREFQGRMYVWDGKGEAVREGWWRFFAQCEVAALPKQFASLKKPIYAVNRALQEVVGTQGLRQLL